MASKLAAVVAALMLTGCIAGMARAETIVVSNTSANLDGGDLYIVVGFSGNGIPAALWAPLKNADNYAVAVTRWNPSPDGGQRHLPSEGLEVLGVTLEDTMGQVELHLERVGCGSGTVTVQDIVVRDADLGGTHKVIGGTVSWHVGPPYDLSALESRVGLDLDLEHRNVIASFAFGFAGNATWHRNTVSRQWWHVEGIIPVGKPRDVKAVPGADNGSSGQVPDMLSGSWSKTSYDGNNLQMIGVTARATADLEGAEVVARYTPLARFLDSQGRSFGAVELQAGWRAGDAEWTNVGVPAPDTGNYVFRPAAVAEWAPRLGPINLDMGEGMRFFVRGRCWGDLFKNVGGDTDFRARPFFDGELFYNVSDDYRVFLRGEYGYLPPDLTQQVDRVFVGAGAAF